MKFRLAIGSAVLLAFAFVVNTAFLRSALMDGYQVSEIKRFLIPMESARNAIEKLLGDNNKRLSITGMREIIDRHRQEINKHWEKLKGPDLDDKYLRANGLVDISIVLKSGSKLVTTASEITGSDTSAEIVEQILEIANGESTAGLEFVEDNNYYYVPHLLVDSQGRWFVSLIFQFQKETLRYTVAPRLGEHIIPTILVGIFSVFGILFLYFQLAFANRVTKNKDFVVDFVLITLASLLFSLLLNAVILERQILEASINNARETTAEISTRLNDLLALKKSGVTSGKQKFGFSESFSRFDNFEAIILTNSRGKPVYRHQDERGQYSGIESAIQTAVIGRLPEKKFRIAEELTGVNLAKGLFGTAVIHISKEGIFKNWVSMLIKGITILFITVSWV